MCLILKEKLEKKLNPSRNKDETEKKKLKDTQVKMRFKMRYTWDTQHS